MPAVIHINFIIVMGHLTVHIIRKCTVDLLLGTVHIDVNYVINHLQMQTFLKCMSQPTLEIDLIAAFCVARLLQTSIRSPNIYIYIVKRRPMYADYAINAFQILTTLGYIPEFTKKKGHTYARKILFRPISSLCKYQHKRNPIYLYEICNSIYQFTTGFIYK
jgi:hypothetical protein